MALNIKDSVTEQMATEVAELAGETKTQAVRHGLEELRERLLKERRCSERGARLERFLEYEAWPQVPADVLGQPMTRDEREEILGYGPEGV
ncbi:type II toxin-antitoxin system VapB family antitoxin [Haloactinomyces albus]|uniref:Antitoxin VapB n=1 Tax=Haloactinomyces albus TaxID=1352928 RepID=A0AAE4CJS4_9ACTN|nr:type II toxin-antitoxin system VapB family antitoxin [Haloactinomyces albus]MDR7300385.1 antitoxin VapB [Haloactinomyces albus]